MTTGGSKCNLNNEWTSGETTNEQTPKPIYKKRKKERKKDSNPVDEKYTNRNWTIQMLNSFGIYILLQYTNERMDKNRNKFKITKKLKLCSTVTVQN